MKHTKGKWKLEPNSIGSSIEIHGDDVWIGSVHKDHYTEGDRPSDGFPGNREAEANARLIASAPELLEMCKYALNWIKTDEGRHDVIEDKLEQAIAKAEEGGDNGHNKE